MRLWHVLASRLRSVFWRTDREADLREELQGHLDRDIERLMASGLARQEAQARALRQFGSVESLKEECRDARGLATWDELVRDTRHGLRRLRRDWRFTLAAVLILGLGIGATTTVFGLVNAALLRERPLPQPDRVVNIYQNNRDGRPQLTSYSAYLAMTEQRDVFESVMASLVPTNVSYMHDGSVRRGFVEYATPTYLDVLKLRPSLGRWFESSEAQRGAPIVAVVSHHLWTRVFRSDPSLVGRTIRVQGVPVIVVGVGPRNHRATLDIGVGTDFWLPVTAIPTMTDMPVFDPASRHTDPLVYVVKARLREGRTVGHARAAMDIVARQWATERETDDAGKGITVLASTDVRVHPQADGPVMAMAALVLVIVGLVLAIACSNLATLLLVRGDGRAKEISMRLALGATRRHVVRHLLAESLLVALLGGIAGCVLAWWGLQGMQRLDLPLSSVSVDATLDFRVLSFATTLSLITGLAVGLAPALKTSRVDLVPMLRENATPAVDSRRLTLKNALIVAQVALSVLLLGGTSIFVQGLGAARAHRVGYAVDGVAMLHTGVRDAGYSGAAATRVTAELLRRVQALPSVESAALSRGLPMENTSVRIVVDGATNPIPVDAGVLEAGPGFFETLRIPLLHGRVFDGRDRADTPRVAVVTETMARQHFGGVNAVGQRFRIEAEPNAWTEIIGVVRDTGTGDFSDDVLDPVRHLFYRSYTQADAPPTAIVARTSASAAMLVAAMQRELRAVDVDVPVIAALTMAQRLEDARWEIKAAATFLGGLGGLGTLLASVGLYAVVAFAVARQAREIGIRMALGARRQQVVWSVTRGVAGLIGVGTGVGLALSVFVVLAMRTMSAPASGVGNITLYRPQIDPMALVAIAGVMVLVGTAAAFVPARRAARMDPLVALRHD